MIIKDTKINPTNPYNKDKFDMRNIVKNALPTNKIFVKIKKYLIAFILLYCLFVNYSTNIRRKKLKKNFFI